MSLTFFSRCEGTTLDGAHDYSAGDTTWTLASSAVFSTDGVKIGTNGLHTPSGDDYATLDAASIATPAQGTIAFWLRINTWGDGTRVAWLQGTANGDRISIETGTTDELLIRHRVNGGNNITLLTTAANVAAGNWYFVQGHWHAANDDLRLEVYNSSGTLIQAVENLSAGLGGALADIISLNFGTVDNSARVSIDNVFIGSAYDDDFLSNRDIISYTEFGGGAAAPSKSLGLLLRGCG